MLPQEEGTACPPPLSLHSLPNSWSIWTLKKHRGTRDMAERTNQERMGDEGGLEVGRRKPVGGRKW